MSSEYITSDICKSPAASVDGIDVDLEIKSEPASAEEISEHDSGSSHDESTATRSAIVVLPDCKKEKDVLDEPLVDIDSITVSQEIVEVDEDPSLLLFVNRDSNSLACSRSGINLTKRLLSEEESADRKAVTRALRNFKRKLPFVRRDSRKQELDSSKVKTTDDSLSVTCVTDSDCSLDLETSHYQNTKSIQKISQSRKIKNKKRVKVRKKGRPRQKRINSALLRRQNTKRLFIMKKTNLTSEPFDSSTDKDFTFCNEEKQCEGKENTQNNNGDNNSIIKMKSNTVVTIKKQKQKTCDKSNDKNALIEMEKPDSYECTICEKKFKEKSHLATHSRAHIDIRNFKCDECGNMYKTKTNLHFHLKTHEEAPFTCEKCNKTFPERKILKRHIRVVHSGEGKFVCGDCGRSFKSARNLQSHFTLHVGNKPYACQVCGKKFVYKSTYTLHMKAHAADDVFQCDQCPQGGDKAELRRTCNHLSDMRPWLCTVCGKAYPLKATLKSHMKTHEPEKQYRCEECGKSFAKKMSLECHAKKHTGERPQFMCDQCSQSYFNAFALKRHYVKHTGQRRFACDLCDKAFWMKDALKVHRRSHAGEKSHPCDRCAKSFAHKHSLVAHLRTHVDEGDAAGAGQHALVHRYGVERHEIGPLPPLHTGFPLPPSLFLSAPPKHVDAPTLHVL